MSTFHMKWRFAVFLICGGISALCNVTSRIFFSKFISFGQAVIAAYFIGMLTAFILFKLIVFNAQRSYRTGTEAYRFVLVNCWGMIQVYILSSLLKIVFTNLGADVFWSENISHLLAVGSLAITSFLLHSYFTFKK